jgi:exodeoxyribonuclease V gamma subunit
VSTARIGPLAPDPEGRREAALIHLMRFIDLYDRGMREPLELACLTSAAYAGAARAGGDPVLAARRAWQSIGDHHREDREPEHELVHGSGAELATLLDETPRADEHGDGWDELQSSRFGRLACRLWDELLAREQVIDS